MTEDTATGANLDTVRHDVNQRLPGLIDLALRRYLDFTNQELPDDAKAFGAYSTACRAALGHLEQLFKLARLTAPDAPDTTPPKTGIESLIANAEAVLERTAGDT